MCNPIGRIVRAKAGREKDGYYCVVGVDQEKGYLLLADGKRRRLAAPKRKKEAHVDWPEAGDFRHPVLTRLSLGEPLSDRELRRALAAFKEGITLGER